MSAAKILSPLVSPTVILGHNRKDGMTTLGKTVRVLAYVHLRNIHNSTGAGRVARQLTTHLAQRPDIELQILL